MNPSYPGAQGDNRHGPPQNHPSMPPSNSSGGGNPSHHSPHAFQSLTQLSHHSTGGLHPLHGNANSGNQASNNNSGNNKNGNGGGMMHQGHPPPLPPPPSLSSSLGQSGATRSPHHPLSGSLLHPPRSSMTSSSNNILGAASGPLGSASSQGASSLAGLGMHALSRSQGMAQSSPQTSLGPSFSGSSAPMSQQNQQSFMHPPSPRRDMQNQQTQQANMQPRYTLERTNEAENPGYYGNMDPNQNPQAQAAMRQQQQAAGQRELRVEDALLYLDQVKQQFGDQPDIYNQFLDVMKDFKAQAIDTPGVILRVSNLFRGYPSLILGFNTFLPPGYRIRQDTSIEVIPQQITSGRPPVNTHSIFPPGTIPSHTPAPGQPSASNPNASNIAHPVTSMHRPPPVNIPNQYPPNDMKGGNNSQPMTMGPQDQNMGPHAPQKHGSGNPPNSGNDPTRNPANPTNPVEFDQAIHYVTKIKQRFADEAETYKEFLAILHTYQKEQRSIRQVLDQVSQLFRDHPDLLREFTFFLPDAVQEQAKERLNRAAEQAQARKDRMNRQLEENYRNKNERGGRQTNNRDLFKQKRNKPREYDGSGRRANVALQDVLVDKEEWAVFEKIKKILPSRESWREFLKCLELYAQEVLGRDEMLSLVKNLFGRHADLVDEFDHLLTAHGIQSNPKEMWPFIPLAETDLSQCRRATPSYRGLPASYPIPPCSYRSELEKEVCNDTWVSVPTGSEDFSFKNMRKNQYEEALFKCEDERFEIDMVIDSNASTIAVLEPLNKEIEALQASGKGEEDLWNYSVDKNTFRVTHLNAIARIYGDASSQILDLLRKYPAGAIPVILKRLRQKDEEWRRARQDLNVQWKEVNEKNYHKSLDHSSFYFKQKDKKQTSVKALLQEAKKKIDTSSSDKNPMDTDATIAQAADALKQTWKPHFAYAFPSTSVHKDVYNLLSYAAEKTLGASEKEKVGTVWHSFYLPFFQLDEEWLARQPSQKKVSEEATTLKPGTSVNTHFGEGSVQTLHADKNVYAVELPIAKAYLQPSAMTIQETADVPPSIVEMDDEDEAKNKMQTGKSLCYGSQHAYVFLRLYQLLHARLEKARDLCDRAKRNRFRRTINPAAKALAHGRHADAEEGEEQEQPGDYQAYLSILYALVDKSVDNSKYEDSCRRLMGSTSYLLFTMDKLVTQVLKQMQHMGGDDRSAELLKLFHEEKDPESYLHKAKSVYEGELAFRLEFQPGVLRRTPVEGDSTPSGGTDSFKVWAPSPRVRPVESSKWLVQPELGIEYLGSVEEEDEDDDDESVSATPLDTPAETPVYGSPAPSDENKSEVKRSDNSSEDEGRNKKRERSDSEQESGDGKKRRTEEDSLDESMDGHRNDVEAQEQGQDESVKREVQL